MAPELGLALGLGQESARVPKSALGQGLARGQGSEPEQHLNDIYTQRQKLGLRMMCPVQISGESVKLVRGMGALLQELGMSEVARLITNRTASGCNLGPGQPNLVSCWA